MLLLASEAAVAAPSPAAQEIVEPNPKEMSRSEIRAHNARLTNDHPFYIKCVRSEPIGSLVKSNYSCRTNRQWKIAEDVGNAEARAIADEMASKSWRTSN